MSFAKKNLIVKGTKKPEKSPQEQIKSILGDEYTSEQILAALSQTNDILETIKILKSEREAMISNTNTLKFQQLNNKKQVEKKVIKYEVKWNITKIFEFPQQQQTDEILKEICNTIEQINIDFGLQQQIKSNFSNPSRDFIIKSNNQQ